MSEFANKPIRARSRTTDRKFRATRLRCHPGVEALERLMLLAAPVAMPDVYATDEDTPLMIAAPGVLSNDTDADGDSLAASLVTGPANGSLVFNSNGSFTYTPNANFSGPDSFSYLANDGTADSNTVTVSLTVTPVNDAPVATADAYATDEDTPLVVSAPGVLANDADDDDDALTAVLVSGPTNGILSLNTDGSFTYTPAVNFNGADSFTYLANDGTADGNTVAVTLTVTAVNDAPVATANVYATTESTPLTVAAPGVLGNDTDADGDPLTALLVFPPAIGSVTLNLDGSFTYVPPTGFSGQDSFTYRADDGTTASSPVTVTINVAAVNEAPVALDDLATVAEDSPSTPVNVLANDTDADGDFRTIIAVTQGANGSVSFNLAVVSYTPNPNYSGADSFTYTIEDGNGGTDTATVQVTVTEAADESTTTLATSPNPSVVGQSVTLIATVAATGGSTTPSGTVSFFDGGVFLGTGTLSAGGVASLITSTLSVGTHSLTAVYNGNAEFFASSSPMPVSQVVVASQAMVTATTTTLTPPTGPAVAGQPVTFRATVAGAVGTGTPTGSVNFFDGTTRLGAGSLDANGVATLTVAGLSAGSHGISAAYGGDATHAASTTPVASLEVVAPSTVTRLQRFGFLFQPTTLVLTFSGALDPASAEDPANYLLVGPLGRAGQGGRVIGVTQADYDPGTRTVTLSLSRRLNLRSRFRLSVRPGGGRPDFARIFDGGIMAFRAGSLFARLAAARASNS